MIDVSALATPVFAFYLIVLCNFIPQVIGCKLQTALHESMFLKHIIGWSLLVFLVILVNPENADRDLVKTMLISVVVYVWFLMTTRTPFPIMISVILLLSVAYVLNITKERYAKHNQEEDARRVGRFQYWLTAGSIALTCIGFIIYFFEKRREYKKKFSVISFLLGTTKCRRHTPRMSQLLRL